MRHPHDAYQIAVTYGSDAETTIIKIRIMTFKRGVVGHEFTTTLDELDTFILLVRWAIENSDSTGNLNDDSLLSIRRRGECVFFDSGQGTPIMMSFTIATFLANELDELQAAIHTFLNARVALRVAA